jgi:hypothetical protein
VTARSARRLVAAAATCLLLAACGGGIPASGGPPDAAAGLVPDDRDRLLGALPDDAVDRGVYVVVPGDDPLRAPASLLDPMLGDLVAQSSVMVETAAPPLTLLGGIPDDAVLPFGAARVDDVVVAGRPEDLEEVTARMAEKAAPRPSHAAIARSDAPVAWSGPLPGLHSDGRELGDGRALLELRGEDLRITVEVMTPVAHAAQVIAARLADGAPPGSPGKPWSTLLLDAQVTADGDVVRVQARTEGLDGRFLRSLLDGQGLSFLAR